MMATKKYRSKALEAAHEAAHGLYRAGIIDKQTMRGFDASCLTTVELHRHGGKAQKINDIA